MNRLKEAMLLLVANDAPLGPEWLDHPLKGEWQGYRECHIGGDFLLIYDVDETIGKAGTIYFTRAGTHSGLFRWAPTRKTFPPFPSRPTNRARRHSPPTRAAA